MDLSAPQRPRGCRAHAPESSVAHQQRRQSQRAQDVALQRPARTRAAHPAGGFHERQRRRCVRGCRSTGQAESRRKSAKLVCDRGCNLAVRHGSCVAGRGQMRSNCVAPGEQRPRRHDRRTRGRRSRAGELRSVRAQRVHGRPRGGAALRHLHHKVAVAVCRKARLQRLEVAHRAPRRGVLRCKASRHQRLAHAGVAAAGVSAQAPAASAAGVSRTCPTRKRRRRRAAPRVHLTHWTRCAGCTRAALVAVSPAQRLSFAPCQPCQWEEGRRERDDDVAMTAHREATLLARQCGKT